MWQGKHLRHQGVEGLAVGNGPHPICKEWHWVKDFQGRQFMSFVLLLKKKPDDETRLYLRTWWCWLLSQPQDQIAQKEEARLTACTFWWQNLYFWIWTDAWKSYKPAKVVYYCLLLKILPAKVVAEMAHGEGQKWHYKKRCQTYISIFFVLCFSWTNLSWESLSMALEALKYRGIPSIPN